ncbi:Maturation and nuclear export of 40S ribosomal subunits interacting protein, partial [Coemansia sp. RSA 2607]
DDGSSVIESVRRLEAGVLSSQNKLNNIVDIFNIVKTDSSDAEAVFTALGSLGRVYAALWAKGLLTRSKDDRDSASVKVKEWLRDNYNQYIDLLRSTLQKPEAAMQVMALKQLMQMLEKEGAAVGKVSGVYEFPNESYLRTLEAVLDNDNASDHVLRTLADSYLNIYDDLRMYFYRDLAKIASPDYDPFKKTRTGERGSGTVVEKAEAFVQNAFAVLNMIRVMPKRKAEQFDSLWVPVPSETGRADLAVVSPGAHKKAFSEAWLAFMRQPLTADIFKQTLQTMHKRIIPHMNDPRSLMDFLSN